MHPETHLQLHRVRSAELRRQADDFRLGHRTTPRGILRTRLGWTMVALGLRLLPDTTTPSPRALRTA